MDVHGNPALASATLSPAAAANAAFLACTFVAFAVGMAYLPKWLSAQGLDPQLLGLALALGAAGRLVGGMLAGRIADALGDRRRVLRWACLAASLTVALYLPAAGLPLALVAISLLHGLWFGPIGPLSELVTLRAARRHGYDYGRVRACGSTAFLIAVVAAGMLVDWAGIGVASWLLLGACVAAAIMAQRLPDDGLSGEVPASPAAGGYLTLLQRPDLRALLVVSGLIQGSHAMYYGFSTVHWTAHGHDATVVGLLWASGVGSEVLLFLAARGLAEKLGPVRLALAAAAAGLARWGIAAETVWLPALFVSCMLHGLTFGAMHLAAMRFLQERMPPGRAAMGQTLLAALGSGLWLMAGSLLSGPLYAAFGGRAFWAMAAMCMIAVPCILWLSRRMTPLEGAR